MNDKLYRPYLPEQTVTNFRIDAIVYRNLMRPKVDELFTKARSKVLSNRKKKYLDYKARQLWRRIIRFSNNI